MQVNLLLNRKEL